MDIFSSLDVVTLLRLMFVADVVVIMLLLGYGSGGSHAGVFRAFVAARSLHAVACLTIGFGIGRPTFWGMLVPTAMVFFGLAIEGATIAVLRRDRILGRRLPFGVAAIGSLLLVVATQLGPSMVGVASGTLCLIAVYICAALIIPPERSRLVWMMFAIFAAHGVAQALRAYIGLAHGVTMGDRHWMQVTGLVTSYVYCVGGGVGFLLLLKEETDRKLRHDAATDSLTGLLNHRAFFTAARQRLDGLPLEASLSLLSIDLDHFKLVNDTYGHPAGDEVLRQVGARLAAHCDEDCVVGRVGGEEFAMLVAGEAEAAREKAERLRQSVMTVRLAEFPDHRCTASIGVATVQGRRSETIHALVRRCDRALYEAKSGGRNRVVTVAETCDLSNGPAAAAA